MNVSFCDCLGQVSSTAPASHVVSQHCHSHTHFLMSSLGADIFRTLLDLEIIDFHASIIQSQGMKFVVIHIAIFTSKPNLNRPSFPFHCAMNHTVLSPACQHPQQALQFVLSPSLSPNLREIAHQPICYLVIRKQNDVFEQKLEGLRTAPVKFETATTYNSGIQISSH